MLNFMGMITPNPRRSAAQWSNLSVNHAAEVLELREFLSATSIENPGIAVHATDRQQVRYAVPMVGGAYSFGPLADTITITQSDRNLSGRIFKNDTEIGFWAGTFVRNNNIAIGNGSLFLKDDALKSVVGFHLRFRPNGEGGFRLTYRHRVLIRDFLPG